MTKVHGSPDSIAAGTSASLSLRTLPPSSGLPTGQHASSAARAAAPPAADQPLLPDTPWAGEALVQDRRGDIGSTAAAGHATSAAGRLAALRRIVAAPAAVPPSPAREALARGSSAPPLWSLGDDAVDGRLGADGLTCAGIHEVKPALSAAGGCHAGDGAAAFAFMLRLLCRRLMHPVVPADGVSVLCCMPRNAARELGRLHAPGLAGLGLAPEHLVLVETARREDTLWALEEGLGSGALAIVVGVLDDLPSTPARRLALRAERNATPCLVLTSPRAPPAPATATRWRIARERSAPHAFDPHAPGALRLAVSLERCRTAPLLGEADKFILEWSDEAYRFHLAAGLADRAAPPRAARRSAA